jgi:16S rRNA processing protein RimM
MSSPDSDRADSLVSVARAVRTRGLKGELVADLLTDYPERFEEVTTLTAVGPKGDHLTVELEDFWFQNDRVILKLVDCDSVQAAEKFREYEFCIPQSDIVELEQGEYFDFDLEGCTVQEVSGRKVGEVKSVLKTGGTEILVIAAENGTEVMVPLAESIVIKIDVRAKEILIDPPEGLLELN